jgi:hypothetical protein
VDKNMGWLWFGSHFAEAGNSTEASVWLGNSTEASVWLGIWPARTGGTTCLGTRSHDMSNRRPNLQGRVLWMNVEKVDGRPARHSAGEQACSAMRSLFGGFLERDFPL